MKKINLFLFFILHLYPMLFIKNKLTIYNITFYDPVSDAPCNYTNYWNWFIQIAIYLSLIFEIVLIFITS